jgi:hypothetical protein
LDRARASWNHYREFTKRSGSVHVDHLQVRLPGWSRARLARARTPRPTGDHGAGRRDRGLSGAGPQAACVPGPQHRRTRPAVQRVLGFLFGVAFLLPLAGDAEPAGLTRIGLFLHRLCDRIRPGTSALFLLVPTPATDGIRLTLGAAEVIQTVFSRDEAAALRRAFAQPPA